MFKLSAILAALFAATLALAACDVPGEGEQQPPPPRMQLQ